MARTTLLKITGCLTIVLIVAAAAAFLLRPSPTHTNLTGREFSIILAGAPAFITVDGEIQSGGKFASLQPSRDEHENIIIPLPDSAAPKIVTLRLTNEKSGAMYDLSYGSRLEMAGFSPHTKVMVRTGEKTVYAGIPMDWNGRIVLPLSSTIDLNFQQDDVAYDIHLPSLGGAA